MRTLRAITNSFHDVASDENDDNGENDDSDDDADDVDNAEEGDSSMIFV